MQWRGEALTLEAHSCWCGDCMARFIRLKQSVAASPLALLLINRARKMRECDGDQERFRSRLRHLSRWLGHMLVFCEICIIMEWARKRTGIHTLVAHSWD